MPFKSIYVVTNSMIPIFLMAGLHIYIYIYIYIERERERERREQQSTPVFLLGELHGQRSPVGYSPRDHRVGHFHCHTSLSYVDLTASFIC